MTLRFILPASLILTIGFPASLEAREPFFGDYRGKTSRTADHAKPKRLKVPAKAVCRQNGPSTYDSRATVTANGNGEKLTIVLVLDASNNGTLTVNGVVLAGPAPKSRFPLAKPKKIKFALKGTGTATFVGPLKQTLQFTGKYGATDFTATGVFDLKSGNTLVLTLKFRFAKLTALGKVAAFSFEGKRS